jgi:hypothetical protein
MDVRALKSQWDRVAAIVLTLVGVLCLVIGYARVAESKLLAEQTRFIISGGIGGIFLLGLGATLWISADLRDEWRKLDRIERALGEGVLRWADRTGAAAAEVSTPAVELPGPDSGQSANVGLAHAASSRDHA